MPTLDELTGNKARSAAILSVIPECKTYQEAATACNRFGATFDGLSPDEYAAAVAIQPTEPAEVSVGPTDTPRVSGGPPDTERPMTRDEAVAHLKKLNDDLHTVRQERMRCEADVRAAREALWSALAAWNGTGGGYSREMLVRDHIASNQAVKQAIAEGRMQPPTRNARALRSVIDRQAYYSQGGGAADHVRAQMKNRGYHRGAFPQSMQQGPAKLKGEA